MSLFDFSDFQLKRAVPMGLVFGAGWALWLLFRGTAVTVLVPSALFAGVFWGTCVELFFCRAFRSSK